MKTIPKHTLDFIDSWLQLRYKWEDFPGFTVVIAKDGNILLNKSYGFANLEQKQKLTPEHLFRIASHSKSFTATALMQLQEKGKLRIDDTATTYLPWLKDHKDKRWQEVTIRQLLSHGAGVIRDGDDSEYWKLRRPFPKFDELKEAVLSSNLVVTPNTQMKYSNYGFALLGYVIEQVAQKSYGEVIREQIIAPLELQDTHVEYDSSLDKKLATGYGRAGIDHQRNQCPHIATNALVGATGFCSTAKDLAMYWQAQLTGSGKLLTDASKREMQRTAWRIEKEPNETYGLGVDQHTYGLRRTIGHGGGFPGFVTRSSIDIDDSTCVVVLTNCWGGMASTIVEAIYGLIDEFGDKEPDAELLKYEGRFDEAWGITEFYANARGLRQMWPNSWYPLWQVNALEKSGENTFRYVEAGGYDNPGEQVEFDIKDGKAKRAKIGGSWAERTVDGDL